MAITHTSSKFTISLVEKDLFEKICNISALNVKYISPDINADSLILSGDEKYFFDTNLPDILSTLAGYFVRVMSKEDTYKVEGDNITLTFTSEKQSSAGEESILYTLVEQYIIVEVLRLWYTSVAVNEVLAAKYTAEISSIDRRLRIALFTF